MALSVVILRNFGRGLKDASLRIHLLSELSSSIRQPASLRDRSNLLGVTPPSSGRSSPFSTSYAIPNGHRYADDLEGQNDEALEGLNAKVKLLKEISIGIGNEVRESAVQLSNMVRLIF
ncbi:hypothetical protein C0995_011295 [Termitomyces sp. Mi166|nr:hypothetical protein C0995_011295 [Termitomyces sp. Mi166\